jgi:hypothetical protein
VAAFSVLQGLAFEVQVTLRSFLRGVVVVIIVVGWLCGSDGGLLLKPCGSAR